MARNEPKEVMNQISQNLSIRRKEGSKVEKKIKTESGVELIATPFQARRFIEEFEEQREFIMSKLWFMTPEELRQVTNLIIEIDSGHI